MRGRAPSTAPPCVLPVSREGVRRLLDRQPSLYRLARRYEAVERLQQDVLRFCGWAALAESLQQDLDAIRAASAAGMPPRVGRRYPPSVNRLLEELRAPATIPRDSPTALTSSRSAGSSSSA